MTREEAIWWVNHLFEIQKEEYFNKRMMEDAKEVEEAQHMAIDALKCKPTVIRCKELLSKEDFEAVVKRIHEQNQNVIVIPCEAEVVSTNTSTKSTNTPTNTSTKSTNISTDASADRPRGEWVAEEEYGDLWVCDQCGFASEYKDNFCSNCGADMRGDDK